MFKPLSAALAAVLLFAAAGPGQNQTTKKPGFDKARLESYVRHLWVLNSNLKVEITDPKPSPIAGLDEVTVHISQGQASQDVQLFISKDGSRIIQGNSYDLATNPFKPDLEKLDTQFQPSFGTPGATVVLVEYSDFECPYCKEEAKLLRENLLTTYPKQVRLYFHEFPLESLHPWAKAGAIAGRCVFNQSPTGFWNFHDWIFAHQQEINAANLKSQVMGWAKDQKDLDVLKLNECIDTRATEPEVNKSIAEGKLLGINGTPTLFINGRRISQAIDWTNLRNIIDNEIEYQKTAKNAGEDCGCDLKLNIPGLPSSSPTIDPGKKK